MIRVATRFYDVLSIVLVKEHFSSYLGKVSCSCHPRRRHVVKQACLSTRPARDSKEIRERGTPPRRCVMHPQMVLSFLVIRSNCDDSLFMSLLFALCVENADWQVPVGS